MELHDQNIVEEVIPGLADVVRIWLREDPILNQHFFIHKQINEFHIRMTCSEFKRMVAIKYTNKSATDIWYGGLDWLAISPANPKFFELLKTQIIREHNRISSWENECKIKL